MLFSKNSFYYSKKQKKNTKTKNLTNKNNNNIIIIKHQKNKNKNKKKITKIYQLLFLITKYIIINTNQQNQKHTHIQHKYTNTH